MATYKVPQDVEADDKLIGPFSFRQFIYLIIVAISGFIAWALGQIFIGLAIIPMPIIIFFGALALPLRKDQPMEIYLAALVSFYLKPRKRIWDPEGIESTINISAPKSTEENRTKNLSELEAEQRLGYLANIVDSGGWAIHGAKAPGSAMLTDVYYDAQNTPDVLDDDNTISQSFSHLMNQNTERRREQTLSMMQQALSESEKREAAQQQQAQQPPQPVQQPIQQPQTPVQQPAQLQPEQPAVLPHDKVIQPLSDPATINQPSAIMAEIAQLTNTAPATNAYMPTPEATTAPVAVPEPALVDSGEQKENTSSTSETPIPADIINLAKNSDGLSISTLSKEANRLKSRSKSNNDEVVISLR